MSGWGSSSLAVSSTWEINEATADSWDPPATSTDIEHSDRRDKKCFNCGSEQHISRDCTEPRKLKQGQNCFNCGSNEHMRNECPEPKKIGNCRNCGLEGHLSRVCPEPRKPREGERCFNCSSPDHMSKDCTVPKDDGIPILSAQEAWTELVKADEAKDSDEVQFAFDIYAKACPEESLQGIEKKLRDAKMNTRLVALKKEEIPANKIILNNKNEQVEFVLQFQIGPRNRRTRFTAGGIANNPEENFERLLKTGRLVDSRVPVCHNCKEKGHSARECPLPKLGRTDPRPTVACVNCGEQGHRARDCELPLQDNSTCHDCHKSGHRAKDCPTNSRDSIYDDGGHKSNSKNSEYMNSQTCHRCGIDGHKHWECPQKMEMKCHNCDQVGHKASDCTRPRKKICRECGEQGHFTKDCANKATAASGWGNGNSREFKGPTSNDTWGSKNASSPDTWGTKRTSTSPGWNSTSPTTSTVANTGWKMAASSTKTSNWKPSGPGLGFGNRAVKSGRVSGNDDTSGWGSSSSNQPAGTGWGASVSKVRSGWD